jgi:hypothetical protein
MAVQKLDIFHSDGRMRVYEHWSIYALFCVPAPGETLVKIGISSIVYDRALALQTGMAYPIDVMLHARVGERNVTAHLEGQLHKAFKHRNTSGEWFKFDINNPEDKAEFHSVFKKLYREKTGCNLSWSKISRAQLRAYSTMKDQERKAAAEAKAAKPAKRRRFWT